MGNPIKFHQFRGKKYKVKFVTPKQIPKKKGDIDSPDTRGKMIRIAKGAKGIDALTTEIHEALHGCFWDISEEAIEQSAFDIAYFLWRLGYRKVEQ